MTTFQDFLAVVLGCFALGIFFRTLRDFLRDVRELCEMADARGGGPSHYRWIDRALGGVGAIISAAIRTPFTMVAVIFAIPVGLIHLAAEILEPIEASCYDFEVALVTWIRRRWAPGSKK